MSWLLIALALAFLNAWTFATFGSDKAAAIAGRRRVPEARLLGLALIGGTPGAFLARRHYRHKARKQPFSTVLMVIAVLQVGAAIGFLIPA